MSVLPNTIIYEILKNYYRDEVEKVKEVSEEWSGLMDGILQVREKYNLDLSINDGLKYFFYNEATFDMLAQLDEEQSKKLGELSIIDSQQMEDYDVPNTFAVDLNEASPFSKLQFPRLHVKKHYGDFKIVQQLVPTHFEEIEIYDCFFDSFFPFPDTLKRLHIEDCYFNLREDCNNLIDFLMKMTWETVFLRKVDRMGPLEHMVVEAWVKAEDPQLKHFSSGVFDIQWDIFGEIKHMGERIDESTILVPHSKLNKKLRLKISRIGAGLAVLEAECFE
uniref:F-box domain-containing protein n=1 Tax=Steinernema glaseri TaxID=37863 RepID=A0A1I7YK66_9BILA